VSLFNFFCRQKKLPRKGCVPHARQRVFIQLLLMPKEVARKARAFEKRGKQRLFSSPKKA